MLTAADFSISFLSILILMCSSWVIGNLLQSIINRLYGYGAQLPLYWKLLSGLFLGVSLYAIFTTKGVTILLFSPILILLLLKQLLKHQSSRLVNTPAKSEYVFLGAAIVLQFIFFTYTLVSSNANFVTFISGDFNIYYRMGVHLSENGVEAYNFNYDTGNLKMPSLYHYGDLWVYALISRITNGNPSVVFIIAFTCLSSIFSLGLFTYIRDVFAAKIQQHKVYLYLILFAGLFAGFQFCFPAFIRRFAEPYTLSIFNWGKVLVLSCSLIGLLILVRIKDWKPLAILSIVAGLFYINSIPAIYGAIFLLLTIELLGKRLTFKTWFIINAIYIGGLIVALIFQYKLLPMAFGLEHISVAQTQKTSLLHNLTFGKYLHTAINIFIGGWLQLLTLAPYFILMLITFMLNRSGKIHFKKIWSEIDYSVLLLFFIFASGLFSWAIIYPLRVDTVQFFHNLVAPVYVVLITLILYYILVNTTNKILITLTLFTVLGSAYLSSQHIFYANIFNKNEWQQMQRFFKDDQQGSLFVNIKPMKELTSAFNRKTDQYIPLNILNYKWSNYQNVSLNAPFIPISENEVYYLEAKDDIATATFTTYMDKCKAENIKDVNQMTNKFIKDFKVKYISVSLDTSLPFSLRNNLMDSLLLKNANYIVYKINLDGFK